jgi:hypothetical protein
VNEALLLYRESGNKSGQAMVLTDLAMIAARQHAVEAARTLYREALNLAWQIGDRRRVAFCLEGLSVTMAEADSERAVCWSSTAQSLRQTIAAPLPPAEQADYEQVLAQLRASLSPEIFEAAWQLGQHGVLAEIVGPLIEER